MKHTRPALSYSEWGLRLTVGWKLKDAFSANGRSITFVLFFDKSQQQSNGGPLFFRVIQGGNALDLPGG